MGTSSPPPGIETTMITTKTILALDLEELVARQAAEIEELKALIAERQADELTIEESATMALRSRQCLRNWVRAAGIGRYDPGTMQYKVFKVALRAYMVGRWGIAKLPPALF